MKYKKNHGSAIIILLIGMTALCIIISPLFIRMYYTHTIMQSREKVYAQHYARQALLAYGIAYARELQAQKKKIDKLYTIKNWPPKSKYACNAQLIILGDHEQGYKITVYYDSDIPIEYYVS